MIERRFERLQKAPPVEPGFMGEGHTAVEVLSSEALREDERAVPFLSGIRIELVGKGQPCGPAGQEVQGPPLVCPDRSDIGRA